MGLSIHDLKTKELLLDVNFWHWRAIVEAVRSLGVLPDSRVNPLHEVWAGELTQEEAKIVAQAMRASLLPSLDPKQRLLLNGQRTTEADDGTFYRAPDEQWKNYSTNLEMLTSFVEACERSDGIRVQP